MSKSPTATSLVRHFLSTHHQLSTAELFRLATADFKPALPEAHALDQQGRIRMKRVANMREGRRIWVPPPTPPFPDHPFRSVRFLKSTVLAELEAQKLIHKAGINRPLETEEEIQAAIRHSAKLTRRAERAAMKAGLPPPPPREPVMVATEYAWRIGPRPVEWPTNSSSPSSSSPPSSPSQSGQSEDPAEVDRRWAEIEANERAYHFSRELEQAAIEERRSRRREKYKEERAIEKARIEEDKRMGLWEARQMEKKRQEALGHIKRYAQQTGEDVSGWFEELGLEDGKELDVIQERKPEVKAGLKWFGPR